MTTSNQLRLDPLTGRWVAVSVSRADRPSAFQPRTAVSSQSEGSTCPFCPEHEDKTPPALESYGPSGNWLVRVLPNLYPAFDGDEPFVVSHLGPVFTEAPASGIHEVLILSPDHYKDWGSISAEHSGLVMAAIRDRIDEHAATPGLRYSQAIVNHGREAGASLDHPHAQLLGVPFVPRELADEQAGFARFAGGCLLCTAIGAEERIGYRVISASDNSLTICPFWSGTPYEILIIPRTHGSHLNTTNPRDVAGVGRAVREAIIRLESLLGQISYNIVFHSAPYRSSGTFHWHVHIIPKLTTRAGFELGTGVMINIVSPETASIHLRDAKLNPELI